MAQQKLPRICPGTPTSGQAPGLVYNYDPGVTSDDGLVAPKNASGSPAQISHFNFCDITCCTPLECKWVSNVLNPDGTVQCGTDVNDLCGSTIDCTCYDDDYGCTTETGV